MRTLAAALAVPAALVAGGCSSSGSAPRQSAALHPSSDRSGGGSVQAALPGGNADLGGDTAGSGTPSTSLTVSGYSVNGGAAQPASGSLTTTSPSSVTLTHAAGAQFVQLAQSGTATPMSFVTPAGTKSFASCYVTKVTTSTTTTSETDQLSCR